MASLFAWLGLSGPGQAVFRLDGVNGLSEADRQILSRLYPIPSGPIVLDPRLFSWINIGKPAVITALVLDGDDDVFEADRLSLLRLYRLPASGSGGGAFGGRKRFSWLGMSGPGQAVYVMDGVLGIPREDRKHFLGLYRIGETVITGRPIGAYVRFNRLGAR